MEFTAHLSLEVLTALPPKRAPSRILGVDVGHSYQSSTAQCRVVQLLHVDNLQTAFDSMHNDVEERVNHNRKR